MSKTAPRKRPTAAQRTDQTRTLLMIAALVAVIAVVGVVVALVIGSGDDDDDDDAASVASIFHAVDVSGDALPPLTAEIQSGSEADPAIGTQAPVLSGVDYDGNAITIDASADGPTMVVLLAHWCPHCNAEVPRLNEWRDNGDVPGGLNVVGVSTGINPTRPNYPPDEWLQDVDWEWPVLADDEQPDEQTPPPAMDAYGGTSYPTMVIIGSDGQVLARFSGEFSVEQIDTLVDDALANDV